MKTATISTEKISARDRVRKHRESLREKGLRPVQIWIPDTRMPGFAEEIDRQCRSLRNDPPEQEIMEWLDQVRDTSGWV